MPYDWRKYEPPPLDGPATRTQIVVRDDPDHATGCLVAPLFVADVRLWPEDADVHAERLVRAANAHDTLVAALQGLLDAGDAWRSCSADVFAEARRFSVSLEVARAVLAEAKGDAK